MPGVRFRRGLLLARFSEPFRCSSPVSASIQLALLCFALLLQFVLGAAGAAVIRVRLVRLGLKTVS